MAKDDDDYYDSFVSVSYYQPKMWPCGTVITASASTEAPDGADCLSEVESEDDTHSDGLIEV